jgi:hypothetical protein
MKFTTIIALVQTLAIPAAMASAILPPKAQGVSNTAAQATAAGLLPRQATCALHTKYDVDWQDGGYRRYAVKATADGVTSKAGWMTSRKMLEEWCAALVGKPTPEEFERDKGLAPSCLRIQTYS